MNTPILFLIFNRVKETKIVFDKIKAQKPTRLYIASDGPRNDKEKDTVIGLRNDLLALVDWDCEVRTLFREKNIGCGSAVSSAISWFFESEEMGIILEDDCLPNSYFFSFCSSMLERYKENTAIMHVCGNNYLTPSIQSPYSYHFSYFPQVWGWATWRRAWLSYDFGMSNTPLIHTNDHLNHLMLSEKSFSLLKKKWQKVKSGKIDTWDIQWHYTVYINHGLVVVPKDNLISNSGFGEDATHTKNKQSVVNKAFKIQVPNPEPEQKTVVHPPFILVDPLMIEWFSSQMYQSTRKVWLAAWKKLYLGKG